MSAKRGFSLTELLIGMFLMGLLFTVVLMIFLPQMRIGAITRHVSETQEDAIKSHSILLQDLAQTSVQMILNNTDMSLYPPPVAVSFPVSYNGQNFFYQIPPNPPAPSPVPLDPLTNNPILEKVPAWNAYLVYFVDSKQNLWRVAWPACGCSGLAACGIQTNYVNCSDLTPVLDYSGNPVGARMKGAALSTYATSSNSNAPAKSLANNVLSLQLMTGDSSPTTQTPNYNPLRLLLLVKRSYGEYNPNNPTVRFEPSPFANPSAGKGDTVMILDSSTNASVETGY